MSNEEAVRLDELFKIEELYQLQEQIANAFGVASIITYPDGTPITKPSNFTRLCQNIIRCTEKGRLNCQNSDSIIGRHQLHGPVIQPCLSGGLWDAGASISVGNHHVANWLVGQVRNEKQDEDTMRAYAREIGADEDDFINAYREIPVVTEEKFTQIAQVLFTLAKQLSEKAYYSYQQAKYIKDKQIAERALLESEERYKATLYGIGDGVITTDSDGKVRMMNHIAELMTGWTQSEAIGKPLENVFVIINEETRKFVEIPVRRVLREGIIVGLANHTILISNNGVERPIADSAAPVRNEKGDITGVVLVFSDQSEQYTRRRLLELRLKFFEYAANHNKKESLTHILDEIGRFTESPVCFLHFMPEYKEIFGLQNCLSTSTVNDYCQNSEKGLYCKNCGSSCWNEKVHITKPQLENNLINVPNKKGLPFIHKKLIRELVVPIIRANKVVALLGIGNKNSDYKDIDIDIVSFLADIACEISESKIKEENLLQSEERFHHLFERAPLGYQSLNADGFIIEINDAWCETLGYSKEEAIGKWFGDLLTPEFVDKFKERFSLFKKIGKIHSELEMLHKNGERRYIAFEGRIGCKNDGSFEKTHCILQDVTELKLAEKREKNHAKNLANILESISDAFVSLDNNWCYTYMNKKAGEIFGRNPQEMIGKHIWTEFPEGIGQVFYHTYYKAAETKEFQFLEEYYPPYDLWFENRIYPSDDGLSIFFHDITERKKAQQILKEHERQLASMLGNLPGFVYRCKYDENWTMLYVSEGCYAITGYHPEELVNNKIISFNEIIKEKYREHLNSQWKEVIANNKPFYQEYEIITAAGETRCILEQAVVVYDDNHDVKFLEGYIDDISERKQALLKLSESELKYRNLFEKHSAIKIIIDPVSGRIVDANKAALDFYGWGYEELIQKKIWQINAMPVNQVKQKNGEALEQKNLQFDFKHRKANGDIVDIEVFTSQIIIDGKEYFHSIIHDITEKKRAEIALKESEETIRLLFNSTAEGIYGIDNQGNCIFCNKAALSLLGYSDEKELIGANMHNLIHHSYKDGTHIPSEECIVYKAFKEGIGSHCDNEVFWNNNGKYFPVEYWSYPIIRNNKVIGSVVTFIDITLKQKLSEDLAKSESKYRHLFENNPAPMWIYDLESLSFLEVNKAAINNYGYSRDEFLKMTLKDIRPHDDIERLLKDVEYTKYLLNDAGTWRHKKKNGELIYVGIVSHKIDFETRPARLVISTDITSRVTMQHEIEQERLLLRTLIDNLPIAVYIKDYEGKKIISNKVDWERFGFENESQIIGKTSLDLHKGELGNKYYNDDLKVIQTGNEIINREDIFPDLDGAIRYFRTSKIPLYGRNREVIGLLGVDREVTESKKANELISKLSRSVEQSSSIVLITDKTGQIEYVNSKFSEVTGYSKDEAIGKYTRILNSGLMPAETFKLLWESISSGETWSGELHNRKKNGELFWDRTIISPVRGENGEIINYIATKEDITDRKQMEADLLFAKEKAEESDRLKSAFLANMSHEVRTPLNSIIGFSELLKDSEFDESEKNEFIQQINFNGNNLLNIINDIVDISKIEAGEISLRKAIINVGEMIESLKKHFYIQKAGKSLEFRWECANANDGLYTLADKDRLYQVFTNLIGNAIKFTSDGYIEIGCKIAKGNVEFHVKDTGIGIASKYHDDIFVRFRQVETSYNRKFGGNGLGLAITKNLIELMDGKIWVESEAGKGATFYFTLPRVENIQFE